MRKKRGSSTIIVLLFLIIVIAALAYVYNSKIFERDLPKIELEGNIHWNLKKPIPVKITDDSGVKFVRTILNDGKNSIVLEKKVFDTPLKELILQVEFPKTGFITNNRDFQIIVEAVDDSKWNFFSGNESVKRSNVHVDIKKPELYIINNSYKIIKGGSATVVFKAQDENLKELYIETNFGKRFYPTPFYKQGHYVSLLAWPNNEESFKGVIIAKDEAGNISKNRIRFYLKGKNYRESKITLGENFLEGKITDIAEENSQDIATMDTIQRFKYVNEDLRISNEDLIDEITSKVPQEMLESFSLQAFYPLKNAAAVASFGDHRYYKKEGRIISESYHLGLDLASTAQAEIRSSNPGEVVFARYNGIYGKNIIISHGLGVYSLYGHCSSYKVEEGEQVNVGDIIANTGKTGLALGDHLHFGILVQGVEVRPEEWMDKNWMKDNVFDVLQAAKKIIER